MIITISGAPGSGTTTLARRLSIELGLRWINSGEIFRRIASERNISVKELNRQAEKNPEIDYLIVLRKTVRKKEPEFLKAGSQVTLYRPI